jgi:hypothetical protein
VAYREKSFRRVVLVNLHKLIEIELLNSLANTREDFVKIELNLFLALNAVLKIVKTSSIFGEGALFPSTSRDFTLKGASRTL